MNKIIKVIYLLVYEILYTSPLRLYLFIKYPIKINGIKNCSFNIILSIFLKLKKLLHLV